ncbi:hypothetical protein ACJJTC_000566 [Scirpophaga incertulas]
MYFYNIYYKLHATFILFQIFDWDKKTQSLILSSFFWGYLVMQIPAGIVAKRFGGKPILLFALASNMVICLLGTRLLHHGSSATLVLEAKSRFFQATKYRNSEDDADAVNDRRDSTYFVT